MPVWLTRPDRGDPATLAHACPPDHHGRSLGPACGTTSHGLWLAAWTGWADIALEQRCAACTRALPPPAAAP